MVLPMTSSNVKYSNYKKYKKITLCTFLIYNLSRDKSLRYGHLSIAMKLSPKVLITQCQ